MRLRWTPPAARDLTAICDFLEHEADADIALKVARKICEGVKSLRDFPNQGRPGRIPGVRELPCTGLPYLAFYRVEDQSVVLLAIRHGARR